MMQPAVSAGSVVTFEMLGRPRLLRPVNLLGLWNSAGGFPQPGRHPSEFQDPNWGHAHRDAVAYYLDTGFMYLEVMYGGVCLMGCRQQLQHGQHFTDGHYAWTGALSHYVMHHHLRPPEPFTNHARRRRTLAPGLGTSSSALARAWESAYSYQIPGGFPNTARPRPDKAASSDGLRPNQRMQLSRARSCGSSRRA